MTYKYQYKFDRKSLPVYAIAAGSVLVAVSSFFWSSNILFPLLCCGVSAYIVYQVARILIKLLASKVVTYDEGFTVTLPNGEKKAFQWNEVTHAGKIITGKHAGAIFAYNENIDTFTQLTTVFSDFDTLEAEMKAHLPMFTDYNLKPEETISEYLHDLLTPEGGDDDDACGDDDSESTKQADNSQSTDAESDDDDRDPDTSVDDDDDREPNTSVDDE